MEFFWQQFTAASTVILHVGLEAILLSVAVAFSELALATSRLGFFDEGTPCSTSESSSCCLGQVRLYALTPSLDLWPVRSIINCSSMPLWNSLVAAVTLKE